MAKQLTGKILSNKMQKTVVVEVDTIKLHPLYKKRYRRTKKYAAHTEESLQIGNQVVIEEVRPLSKTKKWKVVRVL